MPYRMIWEEHGVLWEYYGAVTAPEIEEANDAFYRDPRSDAARYQLVDTLEVTHVEWSDRDIKVTAAYDLGATSLVRNVKVAYVATDPVIIGMMEQYVELSIRFNSSWKFQGFRDMKSARAWLAE